MPVTTHSSAARRGASLLAPLAASAAVLLGLSSPAVAANPVAGSYTLHYEWYSAPGYYQTTPLVLNADHTCSLESGCVWKVSGSAFTLTEPNPRRNGVTYSGVVTAAGLNTSTNQGYMYLGTTGNQHEGRWYATKP